MQLIMTYTSKAHTSLLLTKTMLWLITKPDTISSKTNKLSNYSIDTTTDLYHSLKPAEHNTEEETTVLLKIKTKSTKFTAFLPW